MVEHRYHSGELGLVTKVLLVRIHLSCLAFYHVYKELVSKNWFLGFMT